jgi:uncharacterized damage-inducible protein DinB
MSRRQLAIEQIDFARNYTLGLLAETPMDEWFRQPRGGVSHVGWQVGHLAFAQYRMALWRIRGEKPNDGELLPAHYYLLFGANSTPDADPTKYPDASEIRSALDRIHKEVLRELASIAETELDQEVLHPHPFANTKMKAILWCAHHEMMHAGQIGLLRRQLGRPPLW